MYSIRIAKNLLQTIACLGSLLTMSCNPGALYVNSDGAKQGEANSQEDQGISETTRDASNYDSPITEKDISEADVESRPLKTSDEPVDIAGAFLTAGYVKHSESGDRVLIGVGLFCDKDLTDKSCSLVNNLKKKASVTAFYFTDTASNPSLIVPQDVVNLDQDPVFDAGVWVAKDLAFNTYIYVNIKSKGSSFVAVNNPYVLPGPGINFKLNNTPAGLPVSAGLTGTGLNLTEKRVVIVNDPRCYQIDQQWTTAFRDSDGLIMQRDNGNCANCRFTKLEVNGFSAESHYTSLKVDADQVLAVVPGSENEIRELNNNFCDWHFNDADERELCKAGSMSNVPLFLRVKNVSSVDDDGHNEFALVQGRLESRSGYVICQAEPHTNFDTVERDYLIAFPKSKLNDDVYLSFCTQATIAWDPRTQGEKDADRAAGLPELEARCPQSLDITKRFYPSLKGS